MRISNAVRHIEHIASLPLTPHIVIPEMLRALDGVVPDSAPGFFWVDDRGAILDACLPTLDAPQAVAVCREIVSICRGDRRAGTGAVFHYQQGGAFHMTLRNGGEMKAILSMGLGTRTASFNERERRIVASLAPCFVRALEESQVAKQAFDDMPDRVGIVIASAEGHVLSADSAALRLLAEMSDGPFALDDTWPVAETRLPPFLLDLVRCPTGTVPRIAHVQKAARWGVFRARSFPQDSLQRGVATRTSTHAIMLSRHLPRIVRLMRTIETCDLSPRERQATFQLGIGADSAAAAAALGVSIATWRSYVKRVYQRLDVRDRIELMSFLSGTALS